MKSSLLPIKRLIIRIRVNSHQVRFLSSSGIKECDEAEIRAHYSKLNENSIRKGFESPSKEYKNVLITAALPYVNNEPHLGNIIGSILPADVHSRYCRLRNHNSIFICGTDEFGTTTEIKAKELNCSPKEICDKYHEMHKEIYEWFNVDFDKFGRTSQPNQTEIVHHVFEKIHENGFVKEQEMEQLFCKRCECFLADRFVEGTCPSCGYEAARGDQCDSCGRLMNATELINPHCKRCRTENPEIPEVRTSRHLFFELPKLQEKLEDFFSKVANNWTNIAVSMSRAWLKNSLQSRCITRDLKWGTSVPLENFFNKVFYVWFDAPLGYISITASLTENWREWWQQPELVQLVQFMAKDNIPFHSVLFPATLIATGQKWTMVNRLRATHYLMYENQKFSKSRNVGLFGSEVRNSGIEADLFRFYLIMIAPETDDASFNFEDMVAKINADLVANLGNLCSRTLKFCHKHFDNKLPDFHLEQPEIELLNQIHLLTLEYVEQMEKCEQREGLNRVLSICRLCNAYLQSQQPWQLVKDDLERAKTVVNVSINVVALAAQLLWPFAPRLSLRVHKQLNLGDVKALLTSHLQPQLGPGHLLGNAEILVKPLDASKIRERFGKIETKEEVGVAK